MATQQKVKIQLADDNTGKNVDVEIVPNGHSHNVTTLVANTAIESDGFLTSVSLVDHFTNVTAVVKNGATVLGEPQGNGNTFVKFDRTAIANITIEATRAA